MDISEVAPGLYIASRFYPFDHQMPHMAVALDCAVLSDDDWRQDHHITRLAQAVIDIRFQLSKPDVVLICEAGRNRSAVVAARALMLQGMSAEEAIKTVRQAREPVLGPSGGALTNQAFVDYLMAQ